MIPARLVQGSPATLRQLILMSYRREIFAALFKMHNDEDVSEGYAEVLSELEVKPPTPPHYPILLTRYEATKEEIEAGLEHEPYIDVSLLNPNFREPPAGLEPYHSNDESVPAGHYNANADCYQKVFSMGFAPWDSVIDAPVWLADERVYELAPTVEHIVAQILWELTFYSYSEQAGQALWGEIQGMVEDYFEQKKLDKGPASQ